MIYDNISWHAEAGDFPSEVPRENGGTHIGVFLVWLINNNLLSDDFENRHKSELEKVRAKQLKPSEFLVACCGAEICDKYFNEEGNRFTQYYYSSNKYLNDYAGLLGRHAPSIYHVSDSWKVYELVGPTIDQRYASWKKGKKWWEFWK